MSLPAPPADKDDDDSWGKLASELLGITLDPPDFDFPEAAPVVPPVTQVQASPNSESAVLPPAVPVDDSRRDVATTTEAVEESSAVAESQAELESQSEPVRDAYWDALESWDWEEPLPAKAEPRGESSRQQFSRSERPRSDTRDVERRDRAETRDRKERPRRGREDASRGRPSALEGTQPSPARPRPTETRRSEAVTRPPVDDDFASGLFEDEVAAGSAPDEPAAAVESFHDAAEPDEFDGEWYGSNVAEDRTREELSAGDEETPRPRRRRRRRRGRRPAEALGVEAPTSASDELAEDDDEDEEVGVAEKPETVEADSTDDGTEPADMPRRRRRRRRRRRGSERPEARLSESAGELEETDTEAIEEAVDEARSAESEFERRPRIAVSYEDIPTWEEAISYLARPRSEPPRGRGDAERRGPRPPARRTPTDGSVRDEA